MNVECSENTAVALEEALEESLAYLRTLANFGGTLVQSRELAQKGLDKVEQILKERK